MFACWRLQILTLEKKKKNLGIFMVSIGLDNLILINPDRPWLHMHRFPKLPSSSISVIKNKKFVHWHQWFSPIFAFPALELSDQSRGEVLTCRCWVNSSCPISSITLLISRNTSCSLLSPLSLIFRYVLSVHSLNIFWVWLIQMCYLM